MKLLDDSQWPRLFPLMLCLCLFSTTPSTGTEQPDVDSRTEALLSKLQRAGEISAGKATAFRKGSQSPGEVILASGQTLESFLALHKGQPVFELVWTSVSGGGGVSADDSFELTASTGQTAAGTSSGFGYELNSGFITVEDDGSSGSEDIFGDGFEDGDTCAWSGSGC